MRKNEKSKEEIIKILFENDDLTRNLLNDQERSIMRDLLVSNLEVKNIAVKHNLGNQRILNIIDSSISKMYGFVKSTVNVHAENKRLMEKVVELESRLNDQVVSKEPKVVDMDVKGLKMGQSWERAFSIAGVRTVGDILKKKASDFDTFNIGPAKIKKLEDKLLNLGVKWNSGGSNKKGLNYSM